jgi:membrane protease YdiL (CAAX protease family)
MVMTVFDGILIGAAAVVILHGRLAGWYALPDSASTTNRSSAEGFFVFAGLMLLGLLGHSVVAPLQSAYPVSELEVHTLGLLLSLPLQIVLLATVARFFPTLPVSNRISRREAIRLGVRRFVPVCLVVAGVAQSSLLMRQLLVGEASDPVGHVSLVMLVESSGWVVPTFVLLVTLAVPWLEEVAFRGMLQPALSSLLGSAWLGLVVTAALFATAHLGAVPVDGLPGLFVLGLGLGVLRAQTGRIESAVVVHVLFNLLNIVLAWISTSASV